MEKIFLGIILDPKFIESYFPNIKMKKYIEVKTMFSPKTMKGGGFDVHMVNILIINMYFISRIPWCLF